MTEKRYLDAQQLLEDSMQLGVQVLESGFKPTFIIAIWRGGAPIGIAVQEVLKTQGVNADHIAIRTSSYHGIDGRDDEVKVFNMSYLIKKITHEDRLLIVDDVFDTGNSIEAVISHLKAKTRLNAPQDIRVAVPFYKPTRNQTTREPDYYLYETEQWLKFPHSLEGLTIDEMRQNRPELLEILSRANGSMFEKAFKADAVEGSE
ncbi:phosphoribosyltransferase family protein [Pseudomonadales bacterium]|nr:phosphoribosyltransferase family protein [Pseudomonadales bacterium]MDG1000153.1 phosphoribosyltransferase family protein [Pseudomonadales bacterium]MDG1302864.1 phosphoribosyltransferase family protein [Pseudomonadales bacterium]MDG1835863.1 phosphoribosyltransferase family protein [Pseudomonadales bacterium]